MPSRLFSMPRASRKHVLRAAAGFRRLPRLDLTRPKYSKAIPLASTPWVAGLRVAPHARHHAACRPRRAAPRCRGAPTRPFDLVQVTTARRRRRLTLRGSRLIYGPPGHTRHHHGGLDTRISPHHGGKFKTMWRETATSTILTFKVSTLGTGVLYTLSLV